MNFTFLSLLILRVLNMTGLSYKYQGSTVHSSDGFAVFTEHFFYYPLKMQILKWQKEILTGYSKPISSCNHFHLFTYSPMFPAKHNNHRTKFKISFSIKNLVALFSNQSINTSQTFLFFFYLLPFIPSSFLYLFALVCCCGYFYVFSLCLAVLLEMFISIVLVVLMLGMLPFLLDIGKTN